MWAAAIGLVCCAQSSAAVPEKSASTPGSASVPQFARSAAASAEPPATAPATATATPPATPASAGAGRDQLAATASATASSSAAVAAAPLSDVEVRNVGMHIGGDPHAKNDVKQPIRDAVKPHYDALRACYAKAEKPGKEETVGVDLHIPGEGGRAKVTKTRITMKGQGLGECTVAAFERIDFARPPKGVMLIVSFSVQFRRK